MIRRSISLAQLKDKVAAQLLGHMVPRLRAGNSVADGLPANTNGEAWW